MKILLINIFHYKKGGSEAVYFNTADILKKAGHDVIFFSTEDSKNIECSQKEYFIKSNKEKNKLSGLLSYIYNTEAASKLESLIKKEKPDIAHVHLFWGGISPSIFHILKKYNIPLVHTAHDYRMVCPAYTFNCNGQICEECRGKHFYKCILKKCAKGSLVQSSLMASEMYIRNKFFNPVKNIDGFIFVSNFSLKKHKEHNLSFENSKNIVLYNFTDYESPNFPRLHDDYFLFFGRLSYEKGVDKLIEAFIKLNDLKLKIVGTGPIEDYLIELTKNNTNIEFLGYKTGNDLKNLISKAKFVVVPSIWYENNPMTIIEAYSLGVPVIGSYLGGIPEIIEQDKTGYIYNPKDTNQLEETLIKVNKMANTKYNELCKCAYEFYLNNFTPSKYESKLISFYNEVLSCKSTI